jgi:multidrug resistance efflux pump
MAEGPITEPVAATDGEAQAPPQKRGMKRSTRIALLIILVVALGIAGTISATYIIDTRNYVTTDNAQIDGDKISVNAPTSGTLIDWHATQGTQLQKDTVVGRVRIQGGFVQPQMAIRAPGNATVVIDNGVEGAFVTAGTELAVAYDFAKLYVTARVDETDINDVHPGQRVDISVDAFPKASLTGTVREIQGGAAGVFSLFPQANTSGNFQKVTQVIPVKIGLDDPGTLQLVPGMNVTVKIHKH